MNFPPLIKYESVAEYRSHYERVYCRASVITADGIRIFFSPAKFEHAFFESANRNGVKDTSISSKRAERIDWIKSTLENPSSQIFAGWNKDKKNYEHTRRVAVAYGDFVVVVALSLKNDLTLRGNFLTCYEADNSINKIKSSPIWSKETFLATLQKR